MNGILLIDKPQGITSHDVISRLRKILNTKRIGHAGTLDPLATGLLVILIGTATKLSPYLLTGDKEYVAEMLVGIGTDTEDADGSIISVNEVEEVLEVDNVLNSFIGPSLQTPPMYSAVKQGGKKLYELARAGKTVERKPRNIYVYELKRISPVVYKDKKALFSFKTLVSKGTYIRTLAVDIGSKLSYPAHITSLRRISSGPYRIEDAFTLHDVESGQFKLLEMLSAFRNNEIVEISGKLKEMVLNGRVLDKELFQNTALEIIFSADNELLGVYKKKNGKYYPERIWNL